MGVSVCLSQMTILIVWYRHIYDYCKKSTLPLLGKIYSLCFPLIFIRSEVGRLEYAHSQQEKKIKETLVKMQNSQLDPTLEQKFKSLTVKLKTTKNRLSSVSVITVVETDSEA